MATQRLPTPGTWRRSATARSCRSRTLPLGLSADAVYEELVFRLHEEETLTLYTDGIVEAGMRRASCTALSGYGC